MRDRRFRQPTFLELFTPKLVTVLREGYGLADLRADAVSGLTVAIVALPLSMAFAIASGLSPDRGLYTAIVGGFLVSALGGSRFQIGGPAGAFIVLVYSIVERHGYSGLALATLMAGVVLLVAGLLRFGTYIKYIPFPVTVGFTAGIAFIIFASQIKDLLGLDIHNEPAALAPKLAAIAAAIGTVKPATAALSALAIFLILALRRFRPSWPGMLIAVTVCAAATALLHLDVETIGSRFGGVPQTLPAPQPPTFDLATMRALLPDALTIAMLGAIESLLSAVVADGMSGRRHRSNCELAAQGVANIAATFFGGMPVTGTIARTATNVRTGARGPVSGILHAVFLLGFMMIAAPLASFIPLASLGAVLAVVSWNMAEKKEFVALLKSSRGDALVLVSTFLLTIFEDLTIGIGVGVTLGAFLLLHRLAESVEVQTGEAFLDEDQADDYGGARVAYDSRAASDAEVMVYKISGAIFFGASGTVSAALDEIGRYPRVFIFDFGEAPLVDSTAARALEAFVARLRKAGTTVCVAGARASVRRALLAAGLHEPETLYAATVADARRRASLPPTERGAPLGRTAVAAGGA